MALTQQLARLTTGHLIECTSSVAALDDVCSFRGLPPADYLDLDWSPALLIQCAELVGVGTAVASRLRLATDGVREVNPAYRDAPETIFEHPVNALERRDVQLVTAALVQLEVSDFLADAQPGDVPGLQELTEPLAYLREHWLALVAFYREADARELSVVMWWD